jgi:hypothetical protein
VNREIREIRRQVNREIREIRRQVNREIREIRRQVNGEIREIRRQVNGEIREESINERLRTKSKQAHRSPWQNFLPDLRPPYQITSPISPISPISL